jgi:hypothetical protein
VCGLFIQVTITKRFLVSGVFQSHSLLNLFYLDYVQEIFWFDLLSLNRQWAMAIALNFVAYTQFFPCVERLGSRWVSPPTGLP